MTVIKMILPLESTDDLVIKMILSPGPDSSEHVGSSLFVVHICYSRSLYEWCSVLSFFLSSTSHHHYNNGDSSKNVSWPRASLLVILTVLFMISLVRSVFMSYLFFFAKS